jgi:hypothetical protein
MSGWQNGVRVKKQIDEIFNWLARCYVGYMASWQNDKLAEWQVG